MAIGTHASLSARNLRARLVDYHRRFPEVRTILVDGSGDHLMSDLANSVIGVAFVADHDLRWSGKSLSVLSERVVNAVSERYALSGHEAVHWHDLKSTLFLFPERGPGPEFRKLLTGKIGRSDAFDFQLHDMSLDRLLTLVSARLGIMLALEGATGAGYSGVVFKEVHDHDAPTRLGFHSLWRGENRNASLRPFLDMLRERYPDFSSEPTSF